MSLTRARRAEGANGDQRRAIVEDGRLVEERSGGLTPHHIGPGKNRTDRLGLSVSLGEVCSLEGKLYVTHAGLLRLAQRRHCHGILSEPVLPLCRPEKNFWVFKATVYKSAKCRGFVGYGDAHPGNVSPLIFNHAEMRMAETRAVNRALRKAYGIALCSFEELPHWALSAQQIPQLRRTLLGRSPFRKGVVHAYQNPRPQSGRRTKTSGGGSVPGPGGPLRARRPRR